MTQKQTSLHLFVKDLRSSLQGILWFDIKETLRNWIDGNGCWLSRVDPILLSPTESYWVLLSPTVLHITRMGLCMLLLLQRFSFTLPGPHLSRCFAWWTRSPHVSPAPNTLAASFSCRKHLIVAHTNHGTLLCDEDLAPIDQNQKNGMQQAHAMLHDLDSVIISIQGLFQSSTSICPPCFYVVLCSSSYQFRCLFWSLCWMNEYIYRYNIYLFTYLFIIIYFHKCSTTWYCMVLYLRQYHTISYRFNHFTSPPWDSFGLAPPRQLRGRHRTGHRAHGAIAAAQAECWRSLGATRYYRKVLKSSEKFWKMRKNTWWSWGILMFEYVRCNICEQFLPVIVSVMWDLSKSLDLKPSPTVKISLRFGHAAGLALLIDLKVWHQLYTKKDNDPTKFSWVHHHNVTQWHHTPGFSEVYDAAATPLPGDSISACRTWHQHCLGAKDMVKFALVWFGDHSHLEAGTVTETGQM